MSKLKKYIWYILFYYILFYLLCASEDNINYNFLFITFIPLIIAIATHYIIKYIKEKNYNKVKNTSEKYKKIKEINAKYKFVNLGKPIKIIYENEYSHKGYDRARANSILLYHIENNENNIRELILNAYRNKKLYDEYLNEIEQIITKASNKKTNDKGINKKIFDRIEKKLINEIIIKNTIYNISINVIVIYETYSCIYKKNKIVKYQELCDIYMQWRNSKKYEETSKRERKYMNDKLRYDVLKRDNFKCKKCGISAKDGAKLHVDHIIPVSKGGKTTISNLQTLCDRCNLGKSDKSN